MKFNTLLLSFLFLMAVLWPQGGYTSIDFETDLEAGIESTLKSFGDVSYEPSDFESFTGRGYTNPEGFEEMYDIFMSFAKPRCNAVKALKAMKAEFPVNQPQGATYQGFDLTGIEQGEGVVDFNDQLSFEILRLKLKGGLDSHMLLREQLESAIKQHVSLKTASLKRQYKTAVKTLVSVQKKYELISPVYPDRLAEPVIFEVADMEISALKNSVPDFLESLKSYQSGLIPARAWQGKYERLHKKYAACCAEGEKIQAALTGLREANADNPYLGESLDALGDLPDEGDLQVLASFVAETGETLQTWRVQLAKAKAWTPPVVEVVEEKTQEKNSALVDAAAAVEPEPEAAAAVEPEATAAALETEVEAPVLDAETPEQEVKESTS